MEIDTKLGESVKFTNPNAGFNGDIEKAKQHLTLNEIYTVMDIEIEDWISYVKFKETGDGVSFNTVQFSNI